MDIMPCRYEILQFLVAGYKKTGTPLIGFDGEKVFPVGDDPGLYYFVPKIAWLFGISLDQALAYFSTCILAIAFICGLTGLLLLSKSWRFRFFSVGYFSIFFYKTHQGIDDVYLVLSAIVFAVVPLVLYFVRRNSAEWAFRLFLFLSGIGIGYAHYIRTYSSFAVLAFLIILICLALRVLWKKKIVLLCSLFLGLLIPIFHFQFLFHKRRAYFGDEYMMPLRQHVFWHSFYIGFGFLSNKLGITYKDESAIEKIKKTSPKAVYLSQEYEDAVKKEVFTLIKEHPFFVRITLFAKLGVIFYYLLYFANFGLLAAFFYRKPWILDLAFWFGIGFDSLFGIMAVPEHPYLMGMMAFAVLYSLVSIAYAIEQGAIHDVRRFFVTSK